MAKKQQPESSGWKPIEVNVGPQPAPLVTEVNVSSGEREPVVSNTKKAASPSKQKENT